MREKMIGQHAVACRAEGRDLSAKFRDGMMRGLIAFEMPVERLEGKYKLSQPRSAHDQAGVAAMLEQSDDAMDRSVAAAMRERQ
jgi:transcriptional regulator